MGPMRDFRCIHRQPDDQGRFRRPASDARLNRDRFPGFHEDSIKKAMSACVAVRHPQTRVTHPCP